MGESLWPAIMCFAIAILCVFWGISLNKRNKYIKDGHDWLSLELKKNNVDDKNDDTFTLGNSEANDFLVYTNKDYIFMINKYTRMFNKVLKHDILNVDVEVFYMEKNVKRLIALTATYDKNVKISDIDFKIVTRDRTYRIPCMVGGRDSFNIPFVDRNVALDDVNRCKLILEKDIEKLKNKNN